MNQRVSSGRKDSVYSALQLRHVPFLPGSSALRPYLLHLLFLFSLCSSILEPGFDLGFSKV